MEGETKLSVPSFFREPRKLPAFFNPKGKFVRDVSIICYRAFATLKARQKLSFADSLAGVGARGIRVANEVRSFSTVFLNDTNSKALEFGKVSALLNEVSKKCIFSHSETCSFLLSRDVNSGERFDCVDIDPFGTPSNYVDCAIRATRDEGLLSVTATDSAVLCGVYPKVAQRKYLGLPLRTDYAHEVGMRLIFGLLAMTAMRLETGIRPLFCHHDMHYFRAYCEVNVGNSASIESQKEIGFILHCFNCGYRGIVKRDDFLKDMLHERGEIGFLKCSRCDKGRLQVGGPCWVGKIQSLDFVKNCKSENPVFGADELDIPLYYDLTSVSQKLGKRTPKINDTLDALRSRGYLASRTRLNHDAVRTDAELPVLLSIVRELVR